MASDATTGARFEFETAGVTRIPHALSPTEVSTLVSAIDDCIADPSQMISDYGSEGRVLNGFFLWTRSDILWKFLSQSTLPRIAAHLLNSKRVNLFCDHLFIKETNTPDRTSPWHRDQPHWVVSGYQVVTLWIALDDVTQDSGAVGFIHGSHRWREANEIYETIEQLWTHLKSEPSVASRREAIYYELSAGDILAFSGRILHGAGGNHTFDRRRRGYAVRYTGDDVVYKPNPSFKTPFPIKLSPGDPLDSDLFPIVYGES
jgi:ectoine hydroxylase-related dioxygenase (phytanoyl-CoA dioxygenase family)